MLQHYETEITIFVTGKDWRGNKVTIRFDSCDYENIMIFGSQPLKDFYETESDFRSDVAEFENIMLTHARKRVKRTFFKKRNYVMNYYDKIFDPEFMTHTTAVEITDPKRFKIEYLKKHLSARQLTELFKEMYKDI